MSGDLGDLIAALPVIKALGGGDLYLYPSAATGHRMTPERVENIRPFLMQQEYLQAVQWSPQAVGVDLDIWRTRYNRRLNLTDMMADAMGVPRPSRVDPWLQVDRVDRVAEVVFARSARWQNPAVDWQAIHQRYGASAVFVGLPEEHAAFCGAVGEVPYHPTADYLDLARVVAGASLVCVNQTSIRWLAEGFRKPVIVEVYQSLPNTQWDRPGAWYLSSRRDQIPEIRLP